MKDNQSNSSVASDSARPFSKFYETLYQFAKADNLPSLYSTLNDYIRLIPNICHASFWGKDNDQSCLFLIKQIVTFLEDIDAANLNVLPYEQKPFGQGDKHYIQEANFDSEIHIPILREFLRKSGARTVLPIHLHILPDYNSYLILGVADADLSNPINLTSEIILIFATFLENYSRIRSRNLEKHTQVIIQSKAKKSGLDFLKIACTELLEAFSASTFSLWIIKNKKIVPLFFSEPHEGGEYDFGEGITGTVAQNGMPIFLHVLSDSKRIYGIDWTGKVSDFQLRCADSRDHIMVIPLKYPQSAGAESLVNGVIRFVSPKEAASFWPIDFDRACNLAEILSVLLHQESLLESHEQTSSIQTKLIDLMYHAKPSNPIEEVFLAFLEEMEHWPGITHVTIIQPDENNKYNYDGCKFLTKEQIGIIKSLDYAKASIPIIISNLICMWPISGGASLPAFLIAHVDLDHKYITSAWLRVATLILGYMHEIKSLLQETERLRNDNEQRQMEALAGAVYRLYAHEALNGVKAIDSWIHNAKRGTPNYHNLELRVKEIHANVTELLNVTGFTRLQKKICVFNEELEKVLNKLGFKNLKKLDGCEIRIDIVGQKFKPVEIDPNTLIPIINNLVLNAKEQYQAHNKRGPIQISIIEREIGDRQFIGVEVLDYAIGIPEENKELIFKAGFTTKENGQGLGLWITKKLVESCDGEILPESTLGHFAKFIVLYPIAEEN
jgi:hypothetical protein